MKVLSLFCNVGFGEYYFQENGIDVVVANELLKDRVDFYKNLHQNSNTRIINGDVSDKLTQDQIIEACEALGPIDMVMATPPCQGMSLANATKASDDPRNTLIVHAMELFNKVGAKYMLIENVPNMPSTYIYHKEYGSIKILDYIKKVIPSDFECRTKVLNGKHFKTPQERKRSITLISKNGEWDFPKESSSITTLDDAIRDLPSLEANTSSDLKWHFSSKHNPRHIDWMKHTKSGKSAYFNFQQHYPCSIVDNNSTEKTTELIKNGKDGWHTNRPIIIKQDNSTEDAVIVSKNIDGKDLLFAEIPAQCSLQREIYGFTTAYKRMNWNKPAPTVTMTNGSISSQNNVHPGHNTYADGTVSDARVLTIREVLLVCGLPEDALDHFAHEITEGDKYAFTCGKFGYNYSPSFIRKVLGELFLPKMALSLIKPLKNLCNKPKEPKENQHYQMELAF